MNIVYSEISPLQATWQGSWKRIIGEFNTTAPMLPADLVAAVKAGVAADGKAIILDAVLSSEFDESTPTDHFYTQVTFAPNPVIFPQAQSVPITPEIVWMPYIVGGLVTWIAKDAISNVGEDIGGGINDTISGIMPIMMMFMMMSMMMPMMQGMSK